MATMKDMWAQMIEKMTDQAQEIGRLRYEKAHYEKAAHTWEERALKAEQRLVDQVNWQESSQLNYQAFQVQQDTSARATELLERVEHYHDRLFGRDAQTNTLIIEIIAFLRPGSVPELTEELEEAGVNGR